MAFHDGDRGYIGQPGDKVWADEDLEGVVISNEEFEALTADELRGAIMGELSVMRATGGDIRVIYNGFYEFENDEEEKAA